MPTCRQVRLTARHSTTHRHLCCTKSSYLSHVPKGQNFGKTVRFHPISTYFQNFKHINRLIGKLCVRYTFTTFIKRSITSIYAAGLCNLTKIKLRKSKIYFITVYSLYIMFCNHEKIGQMTQNSES